MRLSAKQIKAQLIFGAVGEFALMAAWCLAAPRLSAWADVWWLGWVYSLTLVLVPLAILLHSGQKIQLVFHEKIGSQLFTGIALGCAMGLTLGVLAPQSGYASHGEAAYRLVYFLIRVGLTEEFIYRGFFYEQLKQICLSDWTPALISSGLFGLAHVFVGGIGQIPGPFVIGLVFCLCREKLPHCSLLSLVIAHGLHDWLIRLV